jgi:hypothetical protein
MLCIFIVPNTRQKLYNNAVIIQLPAVPSDKVCAQFQAMNGGTVGSALYKGQSSGTLRRPSGKCLRAVPSLAQFRSITVPGESDNITAL